MEDDSSPVTTEIPLDLLHEIMSRLPTKSVVRFNCVSKLWQSSFTITTFLLRHSRSPTVSPNTYYHGVCSTHDKRTSPYRTLKLFSFQIPNHGKPTNQPRYSISTAAVVKLTASVVPLPTLPFKVFSDNVGVSNFCDDLVCVYKYYDVSQVILVSARVQDFFPLPKTSLCFPYDDDFSRQHWCSLGFEPTRGEYRVLRSIRTLQDHTRYEILTLGSNSWKLLDAANIPSSIGIQGESMSEIIGNMCLNGVIYWVQSRSVFGIVVASFDLAREEFRAFSGNKLVGRSFDFNDEYYLAPLDGHPALFVSNRNNPGELLYWQWTLSDHCENSILVCHRRIVPFYVWDCTLPALSIFSGRLGSTVIRKRDDNKRYYCYDIEKDANWAIETEGDCEVLQIS